MAISDRLNKLTTDITNAYTSIENKGGTIPANKNTNNLPTAINSIEVIEQATAEGESISLVNTKAMPYSDYVVKGKSEQTTRSGKNLLQNTATSQTISGVTFTVNEDGSITCNGTATNNIFFYLTGNNSIENIILNGCPAGGNGNSYLIRAIDTNGRVLKTDFGEGTEVFNLINARIQIRIAKDYICNNLTFYPMIRLATIEDDTYEPYGASPSPDYPSEIHSVADDVNLFDIGTINDYKNYQDRADKVTWLTIENNKMICIVQDYGETLAYNNNFNFNPNTTYSFSIVSSSNETRFLIKLRNLQDTDWLTDSDTSIAGWTYNSYYKGWFIDNAQQNTVNIPNCLFGVLGFGFYSTTEITGTTQTISNIKIQKGTEVTPYSPYNQGTVTIKQRGTTESNDYIIQTEPLRSLPNGVKDTIEEDGIHRRVGRVVLDGSENWAITTNLHDGFVRYYIYGYNIGSTSALSDYFLVKDTSSTSTENILECRTNSAILINTNVATTLEDFKTWLSTHNTEVLYELAEEIIEPLTQNQATTMLDIIKTGSYENTTNIYTDEDVKPTIGVEYYKKS